MGFSTKLNGTVRAFIEAQPMFFVATAARDGRVNVSPKGLDTLRIVDDTRIQWINLSGSGNETAAHLQDMPRMTLMFMALDGDAQIVRVFGDASVRHPDEPGWSDAVSQFPPMAGQRQIFDLRIDMVRLSCGTGVPRMSFVEDRGHTEMVPYFDEMGTDGVRAYWKKKNRHSIDGRATGLLPEDR